MDFGNALQGVLRDQGIAACIDEAPSQVSPTRWLRDAGVGTIILAELVISLPGITCRMFDLARCLHEQFGVSLKRGNRITEMRLDSGRRRITDSWVPFRSSRSNEWRSSWAIMSANGQFPMEESRRS